MIRLNLYLYWVTEIKKSFNHYIETPNSRDDKIRTCDPQTPSLVRYRPALRPEKTPYTVDGIIE